jgi:CheY-like chemotaxis protein
MRKSGRADEKQSSANRSRRVLIVEDETILGFEVAVMVKSLGHSVVAMAGNEAEAVRLDARMKPDVVLMDVRLGRGPDGIDTAERILQHRFIPIIFCTGYSSDQNTIKRIRNLAPVQVLAKPFTIFELKTALGRAEGMS